MTQGVVTRVLVTGASGLVGRHATARLAERGYDVHAVSRREVPSTQSITWHHADLLEPGAGSALIRALRPSYLLHLAWVTEHGRYWQAAENLDWLAVSLGLIRAFADAGGKRLVAAGTCAEYDWGALGTEACRERETPTAPQTLYGRAKHALHQVLAGFADEAGLDYAWGRLFFLYGPDEPPARLVPSVARALLTGAPARCTHGRQVRDFLHVADAGAAFAALLASDVIGPVNVASGTPVRIAELVETLARIVGRADLVELGAVEARADEPTHLFADATRLNREVRYAPSYELEAGLAETVRWWRERV